MRKRKAKLNYRRIVLRLPDLDHSKMAVLSSLTSPGSRRVYRPAKHFSEHYIAIRKDGHKVSSETRILW